MPEVDGDVEHLGPDRGTVETAALHKHVLVICQRPTIEQHLHVDDRAAGDQAILEQRPQPTRQLGRGRSKTKGVVDVVMVRSLARRDDVAELTAGYGLVMVDECHHVPAVTFERAVREIPVR
jgi:superfamily II DNA or RNA helicase